MNGSHVRGELAKLPTWACPPATRPLMLGVATSLVEAGFTLRHGDAREPGGGPRVDPRENGRGVVVTWITHDTLHHDPDRTVQAEIIDGLMQCVVVDVLTTLGWQVRQSHNSLAVTVTGRRPFQPRRFEERIDV